MSVLAAHGVTRVVVHRSLMRPEEADTLISKIRDAGYPLLFTGKEGVVFATAKGG
jgi:hypothetical protein